MIILLSMGALFVLFITSNYFFFFENLMGVPNRKVFFTLRNKARKEMPSAGTICHRQGAYLIFAICFHFSYIIYNL